MPLSNSGDAGQGIQRCVLLANRRQRGKFRHFANDHRSSRGYRIGDIYGSNLSKTTRGWSAADFTGQTAPASLDGVTVTIGGSAAFIQYVSPGQVNALVPSGVPAGPAQVIVSGPTGTSDPYIVAVQTVQPGLLAPPSFQVAGKQYLAALATDGRFMLPSGRPAKPGETIVLYGIGFGAVTPNLKAGTLAALK